MSVSAVNQERCRPGSDATADARVKSPDGCLPADAEPQPDVIRIATRIRGQVQQMQTSVLTHIIAAQSRTDGRFERGERRRRRVTRGVSDRPGTPAALVGAVRSARPSSYPWWGLS